MVANNAIPRAGVVHISAITATPFNILRHSVGCGDSALVLVKILLIALPVLINALILVITVVRGIVEVLIISVLVSRLVYRRFFGFATNNNQRYYAEKQPQHKPTARAVAFTFCNVSAQKR